MDIEQCKYCKRPVAMQQNYPAIQMANGNPVDNSCRVDFMEIFYKNKTYFTHFSRPQDVNITASSNICDKHFSYNFPPLFVLILHFIYFAPNPDLGKLQQEEKRLHIYKTAFMKVKQRDCFNSEIKLFPCFQSLGMRNLLDLITFSLEKKLKTTQRLAFINNFTTKAILVWDPMLKSSHVSLHSCFPIIPYVASDLSCKGQKYTPWDSTGANPG